jgi:hypothetical protein
MIEKAMIAVMLAASAAAGDAAIYRCADMRAKAPDTLLRVEGMRHIGLSDTSLSRGWLDLCTRPEGTCKIDKHGRLHADFFAVDAGEYVEFDPVKLQLVKRASTALAGGLSWRWKYRCARLTPGEEAGLVSDWKPAPAW